ncbi:5-formyltetrahydrofolate cyclo-ligase [Syncephalis fuscata]|nr:5-formyltetrahydrofolate cyclo-ligase [Syncephalis fuscata]
MNNSIQSIKRGLRKELRSRLRLLSPTVTATESNHVVTKLLQLPVYQTSQRISIFISMQGEIETRSIIENILSTGRSCYIPRWQGDVMEMVLLKSMEDFTSLPLNAWNIPEPLHDEIRENALETGGLDLLVMPGLAFDRYGNRLGHGKGYYDRYIEQCEILSKQSGQPMPRTVALALSAQIVDDRLPCDHFDRQPDCILTPTDIIIPVKD